MDNMLLTIGFSVSAAALLLAAAYFIIYRLKTAKLEKTLDKEYGERKKPSEK